MSKAEELMKEIRDTRYGTPLHFTETVRFMIEQIHQGLARHVNWLVAYTAPSHALTPGIEECDMSMSRHALTTHYFVGYPEDHDWAYTNWNVNYPVEPGSWHYLLSVLLELNWVEAPVNYFAVVDFVQAVGGTVDDPTRYHNGALKSVKITMGDDSLEMHFNMRSRYTPGHWCSLYSPVGTYNIAECCAALQELNDVNRLSAGYYKSGYFLNMVSSVSFALMDGEGIAFFNADPDVSVVLVFQRIDDVVQYVGYAPIMHHHITEDKIDDYRALILAHLQWLKLPATSIDVMDILTGVLDVDYQKLQRRTEYRKMQVESIQLSEYMAKYNNGIKLPNNDALYVASFRMPTTVNTPLSKAHDMICFPNRCTQYSALCNPNYDQMTAWVASSTLSELIAKDLAATNIDVTSDIE